MHTFCDNCKKSVKQVGKLFKTGYFWLCKECRKKAKTKTE